ncbi:conserved hypothetical protein [Trichinella spiralis]|uniref:hypothetical protein n=2 Tax=Trichinella spiralis TaxID=6334 RepID=UPI0001EFE0B7|nr:conserved hypothetical protein [Trichinella spiralis]
MEKREETSTSSAEKSQVSLPRHSGQRSLHNVVQRTSRQLAGERGLKKWITGKPWLQGPGWPAEPLQARRRSFEGSGRTTRLSQVGQSPPGQSELASTTDDAADPRHSTIKGNAAGVWQTSVHGRRFASRHPSAKCKHEDANRTEVTRKPLVRDQNQDTPGSTGHPAGPPGRHVWTETRICPVHWGALHTEVRRSLNAIEQRGWIPTERMRREDRGCGQPKHRRPGCRHATTGLCTRRHPRQERDWCCHQRLMATWWRHWRAKHHHGTRLLHWKRSHKEGRPWTNAPTWDHKEDRRRLHRKPGVVAEPSTVREEVDGMSRCPPGKPGEVSDGRVTLPSGGEDVPDGTTPT